MGKSKIVARSQYDQEDDFAHKYAIKKFNPSRTDQSQAAATDLKRIVDRYVKSGEPLPGINWIDTDFTKSEDFASAMNKIADAKENFDALPSKIKHRFGYDPARLLEFVADASNYDEALKLGLVRKREVVPMDNQIPSTEPKKDPK